MLSNYAAGKDPGESLGHVRRKNQSILKEINPEYNEYYIGRTDVEAEAPIIWPVDAKNQLNRKDSGAGKDWRQKEKEVAENETARQHHWLNGHAFVQTLEL